ncbi:MAG TPA: hypothetical protein VE078_01890 [Thermoanaerobaculia bacterium]|nr:hypothetical protein [Thermoanaerobaculia bacterium]
MKDESAVWSSLVPRSAPRDTATRAAEPTLAAAWEAAGKAGEDESGPTIHVTIGRIEVKAPPHPAPPPARPARQRPRVTLSEYLRRRREGR